MISITRNLFRFGIVAATALAMCGPVALGQDKPCADRVKELEEQLRQSESRQSDLARENASLREQLSELRNLGGGANDATSDAVVPPDPLSSPAALFDALAEDYRAKIGSLPRGSKPELAAYHAAVKEWTRDAAKDFRGPVEWEVRIEKIDSGVKGNAITFYVLDPTGKPVGNSFTKPIPARIGRDAPPALGMMTLKGTVSANPQHNSSRAEKSESDSPRLIGPFAEFDFEIDITSLK